MKKIATCIIIVLAAQPLLAQKNYIEGTLGGYQMPNFKGIHGNMPYNHLGIRYERSIHPKLSAHIAYSYPGFTFMSNLYREGAFFMSDREYMRSSNDIGKIVDRWAYRFADLGMAYSLYNKGQHSLFGEQSFSFSWGINRKVINVFETVGWNGHKEYSYLGLVERVHYFGGVSQLSYRYALARHFQAGAYAGLRYYFGDFPFMFQYGIRLGVRF